MNIIAIAVVALLAASPAAAQTFTEPAPLTAATNAGQPPTPSFKTLLGQTAKDFTKLASADAARWLIIGGAAALAVRPEDPTVSGFMANARLERPFESGQMIGSSPFQMGGSLALYSIGRLTHNARTVEVGGDLFRAQAVAQLTTYAMKYAIRRTRPDGTRFSFPSGHTSVSFASAAVLQRHFGWKAGIPAFGVAAYVAGSRLQTRRHHLSDVAFGAALGILAGRTVTVGRGAARMAVAPNAVPRGVGVSFTLVGNK